ncbi:hypothetical protein [Colwellia psychrerythraea]|nr:hypothetical protein [Colwellia psychrerythraea]
MNLSKNIHVVLATAHPEVANRLLISMQQALPSFDVQASVLLFGMAQPIKPCKFSIPVDLIECFVNYPPIVDNRNICQLHLKQKMNERGGIGFILDDDLLWSLPELSFINIINQLNELGCDMAFSTLSGDSPIPKEYTRTSPLLDVLLAIRDDGVGGDIFQINEYLSPVESVVTSTDSINAHHDFYSFNPRDFNRYNVNVATLKWDDFIDCLVKGKATTRNIKLPSKITPANGRERGGATIVLNSEVLLCKNDSLRYSNFISRRSDMVMASDAFTCNFKLFNTPPLLEHRRDETFDTHDSKKLIGDILGYALVESRDVTTFCQKKFALNLSKRIEQTTLLLIESSKMMRLLGKWLIKNNHIGAEQISSLNSMASENEQVVLDIKLIDLDEVIKAFKIFATNRNNTESLMAG